ncbi:MAG: hypothetical protein DRJ59_01850 [Thermoprotei archaeon]|nr:MAG: hypothetical protein DRJ59_01850 [Thermoprotei archaeon]
MSVKERNRTIGIVTHGDLDGLTSAAIVYDYMLTTNRCTRAVLEISQPYILHRILNKLFSLSFEELYFLDLALDENSWLKVANHIKSLLIRGVRITWIDHHETTLHVSDALREAGVRLVHSLRECTSEIVERLYCSHTSSPSFFSTLAHIGKVSDKNLPPEVAGKIFKIVKTLEYSLLASPGDIYFKKKLVETWVFRKELITSEIERRAKEADLKMRTLHKLLAEKVILSTPYLEVIDLREENVRGYVGKLASERAESTNKIIFVIFTPSPHEIVLTARVPSTINFNILAYLTEISGELHGSRGGHPKAASLRTSSLHFQRILKLIQGLSEKLEHYQGTLFKPNL